MIDTLLRDIRRQRRTEQMVHAPAYNKWIRDSWHPYWVLNARRTGPTVEQIMQSRNADLAGLPDKPGEPVLLLGSGPSLDDWRPYIKDWKGDIFCSTSQLAWLESAGVNPRYVFLIDSDPVMDYLVKQYTPVKGQPIPDFITHPCIQKEAIQTWGRPEHTWFFRMLDPGDEFFTKFLPMMYHVVNEKKGWGVKTYILNSGCVMNTMMVFAHQKKYNPIFLCGYDLGYPGGQYRFQNYKKIKKGKSITWEAEPILPVPLDRPFKPSHNGVATDELCLFYKYSSIIMYGMNSNNLLSCSRGTFDEVPYVSPESVVKTQGRGYEDRMRGPVEAYLIAQKYLQYRKILMLRTGFAVSVNNTMGMKPLVRLKTVLRWLYWRHRVDWEEQGKWYAKKMMRKRRRKPKVVKTPYDLSPPSATACLTASLSS